MNEEIMMQRLDALAASEAIPAGAWVEFTITSLADKNKKVDWEDIIQEWLDYGKWSGIGQWRNSGKGRFTYEVVE